MIKKLKLIKEFKNLKFGCDYVISYNMANYTENN